MKVDLIIENVKVFNAYFKRFLKSDVAILDGKYFYIGKYKDKLSSKKVINGDNKYMIPGLIDIHMHIESSMATPNAFSYELIRNGVTTIVSEPHEIANVFGVEGIKAMIDAGKDCDIDIFYGVPSSVPSTSSYYETTGAKIDIEEIKELLNYKNIICLGEVMNYYDVINSNDSKINKLIKFFRKENPHLPIEGHCPKLLDLDLAKFIYNGVNSDHTQQTKEGMKERIMNGMFIEIQEKSMNEDIINFIIDNNLYEHVCLVTDDVMADTLIKEGHLNKLVKKAIDMGMSPENAFYISTFTPARRMGLKDRGSIAPGKIADFVLLNDLKDFKISDVYKKGKKVFDDTYTYDFEKKNGLFPKRFYESIKLDNINEKDLKIKAPKKNGQIKCRVINVKDKSTYTEEVIKTLDIKDGFLDWENSPYLIIAVFERYNKFGNIGIGLVTGDTIKKGAVATTYAHDHHNLLVVGKTITDVLKAVNTVIENQGGYCVVKDNEILASISLPVAGILSEESMKIIGEKLLNVRKAMAHLGYKHYNPVMSLSTNSLPVSPLLKITDKGLVNLSKNRIENLFMEGQ
ncbi:MAG: amidohydrolase family protein [Firmicutes bacterium]|nr:amidohydrolase family protein [Bacillota bacterium]